MPERSHAAFMVVRKKLGLVGRHIYSDRAIALASFAGETQIERRFDMGISPMLADVLATSALPKQVRPTASRVLLLARDTEAGAHDSALILTALANAHTPQGRFRQTAVVVRKFEMGFGLPGFLVGAQAQVVIHTIRADQLAWIHFPMGVPKRLEFLKRFDKFRAEHLRQQLRTGLAVSVLSRERAAARSQVSGIIHELTELLDAFSGFQVE